MEVDDFSDLRRAEIMFANPKPDWMPPLILTVVFGAMILWIFPIFIIGIFHLCR
jgi:hypothetical protein